MDWSAFNDRSDENDLANLEIVDGNSDCELLLARQHSLLWSEDKYLDIVPAQRAKPMGIIYDE